MRTRKPVNAGKHSGTVKLNSQQISDIYTRVANAVAIDPRVNQHPLSKEEREAIKDTDEELRRRGFFTRIFPCFDFIYYAQFFEEDRPLNYVVDAKLFQKKRTSHPATIRKNQANPLFMQKHMLDNSQARTTS